MTDFDPGMLRRLVDAVPGLVSYIDKDLRYGFLNERYRDWFGIDPAKFIGSTVHEMAGDAGFSVLEPHLRQGLNGHHVYEVGVPFARGGHRFLRGYLVPVHSEDGAVSGMFSLSVDITQDKFEEDGLAKARDEALAATVAKSRFLAAASHDLRQPLHSLTLFASALARRVDAGEAAELVQHMQVTLQSLNQMFNALLDVTKLDAGLVETNVETFPINNIFEAIKFGFEAQAEASNLKFTIVPSKMVVRSDPVLLETIVRNLASNALKFTRNGGVLVGVRRQGERGRIEVWDTGPGIPEDRLTTIFEEFERYNRTANAADEGLGLGLAIVRRLSGLLGHQVTVDSVIGKGSVFRVEFPVSEFQGDVSTDISEPFEQFDIVGKTILVLDDDPVIVAALSSELSDNGADIWSATSNAEALEMVRTRGRPDLVVADLFLGEGTTGLGFLNQLNNQFGYAPPGLIISGSTDAESLELLQRSGYGWLTKPVDLFELHRAIGEALAP